MENNEFYYIKDDEKIGPISFDNLTKLQLRDDTLIWYDKLENWTELRNIEELYNALPTKKSPPPLPSKSKENVETLDDLNVNSNNLQNETISKSSPSVKTLNIFIIWSSIHLFALITSYSEIELFNKSTPQSEKFWPFVEIFEIYDFPKYQRPDIPNSGESWEYNGLFYNYDWSEFLIYVGGFILFYAISRFSEKSENE